MRSCLMVLLLISSACSGCIFELNEESPIELVVEFDRANGTIVEYYVDGDFLSKTNSTVEFDFSNTEARAGLTEFGLEFPADSNHVSINSDAGSIISIGFSDHGIHEVIAYAVDEDGYRANMSILIRMNLRMEWSESKTYDPRSMTIDPLPKIGETYASLILIDSTVYNPELIEDIGGGREVDITWGLFDEQEDACQYRNGRVNEGGSENWKTVHFNTYEIHELRISYEDGQDDIEVEQTVTIEYPQIESSPN